MSPSERSPKRVSLPGIDSLRSISESPLPHSSRRKNDDLDLPHHHRPRLLATNYNNVHPRIDSRPAPCADCGELIPLRHPETNESTMEFWDAHPSVCSKRRPEYTFSLSTLDQPATATRGVKRRRAKRTQEERIAYLRDDPYVAQYEAYKVLCASCNKWIRLRPNSTYCSIPWDAHRKSCLARKLPKNSSSVEERNEALSRDPDVLNFDSHRVHCRICSEWVEVSPHDHARAMQMWLQHRSSCRSPTANVRPAHAVSHPPPHTHQQHAPVPARDAGPNFFSRPSSSSTSMSLSGRSSSCSRSPIILPPLQPKGHALSRPSPPHSPATSVASVSDKQRETRWNSSEDHHQHQRFRSVSQREADLRNDPLIQVVEHNQVLCKLCDRWVMLTQDSPYCVHLWLEHRDKCLVRRGPKCEAIETRIPTEIKAEHRHLRRSDAGGESRRQDGSDNEDDSDSMQVDELSRYHGPLERHPVSVSSRTRPVEPFSISPRQPRMRGPRRLSNTFDISTSSNRTTFVLTSIQHLFHSSYEPTDVLSFSSLLTYLNAAMPPEKFEEFETPEVAKIVYALQNKGRIVVEGDNLRPVSC